MDRTSGVLRKQPVQPQAPPVAATNASTRVTRPVQPSTTASPTHPEPQMEASNGVPLGDKAMSRKRAATAEIPPRPTKAKAGSHLTVTRATSPLPNRDDELLKLLKAEFETLRSLVTCGICFGLLYEPYTTPCGHTFCYNCLCKSFTEERNGVKSCPQCRTLVRHAPAEAYLVRDMTFSFTKHAQLLGAADETVEMHEQARKEQRAAIDKDKNNKNVRTGGLFKGIFNLKAGSRGPPRPWRDEEDGVSRCPDCMWELEHGLCLHCGNYWGSSEAYFSGYSETGDGSELAYGQDYAEFAEMDMEMEYDEFQDGENPEDWYDQGDEFAEEDRNYSIRRFLDPAMAVIDRTQARRPRSAVNARRHARHASMSDLMESEMGSIAEEDEEDEDTSMDGFIIHDSSESQSQGSASASEQTPQPPALRANGASSRSVSLHSAEEDDHVIRPGRAGNARPSTLPGVSAHARNQTSRASLAVSADQGQNGGVEVPEEEDDDEDGLPIAHGRRRPVYQPGPVRRMRSRRNVVRESSEESGLSHNVGQHNGEDADDDGDESDGTTVGWEPTTTSFDRLRSAGSLTPTADRPNTSTLTIPRTGTSTFSLGSRGLRRRSSVLSNTGQRYEDNDADDDGTDGEGEVAVALPARQLRQRTSRVRIGPLPSVPSAPEPLPQAGLDVNMYSDDSDIAERQRRGPRPLRPRETNPRISMVFADIQRDLANSIPGVGTEVDPLGQLRGATRTPIARPRTANRNRPPANVARPANNYNPGPTSSTLPPARLRTPGGERNQGPIPEQTSIVTRPGPTGASTLTSSLAAGSSSAPFATNRVLGETIQRPPSRLPSGYSAIRRNSGDVQLVQEPFQGTYMSPGLNTARTFQSRPGNPFHANARNPFYNASVRPRQSTQRLRDSPSTATLRSRTSTRALRNQMSPANARIGLTPDVRPQASRMNMRGEYSVPRLQAQPSARNLRNVSAAGPSAFTPARNQFTVAAHGQAGSRDRPNPDTVERRQRESSDATSTTSSTSNPFYRFQRPAAAAGNSASTRPESNRVPTVYRQPSIDQ